jgi:hypothetical protein
MSDVAESHSNDVERWKAYQRNRSSNDLESAKDQSRVAYNKDPADMSDTQLINQHTELLRMQKEADYQNNTTVAKDIAKRRMELWRESESRGISRKLE